MIKLLFLLFFIAGCGKPITENQGHSTSEALRMGVPETRLLGMSMSMNFDLLPFKGQVKHKEHFWSGDSWRLTKGSINYRWNSPKQEGRFATPPTPQELMHWTQEDIARLAPSEKYDLLEGRYDYPLKRDVDHFLPSQPLYWEGLCHGWASASMNHREPHSKVLQNPDGLLIPFGSADIKALLTYYYAQIIVPEEDQYGKRCEVNAFSGDACDNDVTAANFHIILTNKLGLRGDSIIVDIDRYEEVWNHPLTGYESRVMESHPVKEGRKVTVRTTLTYVDVAEQNRWEATNHTPYQIFSSQRLEYQLDLDHQGNIVGSRWISRDRPDFIWDVDKVEEFKGYLKDLRRLVED